MISENFIIAWKAKAPWQSLRMVEQDLVLSRALVSLFNHPLIHSELIFRGGTALNKLFINPPQRYSEDIDLVQLASRPIGEVIDAIRDVLGWLGEPKRKVTERSVKLIYRYLSFDDVPMKLKVEINTTEHFHVLPLTEKIHQVDSPWFQGEAKIRTCELNELMGTKLRALYERRKGRDLFDLWLVLDKGLIDPKQVIEIYQIYCKQAEQNITRALFEKNLLEKRDHQDFSSDMSVLLADTSRWDFLKAFDLVSQQIIAKLPGEGFDK